MSSSSSLSLLQRVRLRRVIKNRETNQSFFLTDVLHSKQHQKVDIEFENKLSKILKQISEQDKEEQQKRENGLD